VIGQRIVREEQQGRRKAQYGARLAEELSMAPTADFGKGFSYANLYNFRQFYRLFPDQRILYTLCRELSWSHLRLIIRADSQQAIEYHCKEAREQKWTVRQLERHIKTQSFQRLLSKRGENNNPTIGMILCNSKDETVAKYSVIQENQQLFASKYQRILPTEEELIAEIEREKRLIGQRSHERPPADGPDEHTP
jgi:DUF1016 N-terminal domain/YhcG PDDEXK nuclease domain